MAACSRDLMTERYESWRLVYLPTRAMETVSKRRSCETVKVFHSCHVRWPLIRRAFGMVRASSLSMLRRTSIKPCFSSRRGTWYVEETSCTAITWSGSTWQNMAILSVVVLCSGSQQRHAIYIRISISHGLSHSTRSVQVPSLDSIQHCEHPVSPAAWAWSSAPD